MKNLLYVGNKLSKHGHTATAIEVLGPMLERDGFRVTYASSKKNKLLRLADMCLKTFAKSNTVDYVLIDTYSTWNFWYAFAVSQLCRLLQLKYIPILHGGNLPVRLARNPRVCRMVFGHSVVNVAPSGYLAEVFGKAGFRVRQIPNPVGAAEFRYVRRENLRPKLLWVRSFASLYNPEMALRAFKLIQNRYPDAALCMVGPEKDGLKHKCEEIAAAENLVVTFTGRLSKAEWAAISQQYDIFINTARTDNTPFSIIEALSLGMAVVSTDVGGIPNLLEDRKNGLLVADDDASAMADAIVELVENTGLASGIIATSKRLIAESTWPNVRAKWLEILI